MVWRSILTTVVGLGLVSCALSPNKDGSTPYYEASFDDRNRAPSSLLPPNNAGEFEKRLDSVVVRSKADYNFTMGEAHSFEGQHLKAVEAFRATLLYDPNADHVYLRLAAEYVKLGLMTEALEAASSATKLAPKSVDAHLLLAGIHSTLKDYDRALKEYEIVLSVDSDNTEAPMYMGAVYAEKKEYSKAIKYFESLAKNDDYASPHLAWYYIGKIHSDQEGKAHLKEAEKAYKKSLSIKPDHADSVISLGQIYIKMGKPQQALEAYKNFQKERGPSDRIAEILAQYYMDQEQYQLALEQFEIIEKNSDDILGVKVRIALILIELKKFKRASEKLFEVLRQVPESDKIRFYLAAVYEEMGESDNAVEHFRKVPMVSPFYSEAVVHAAYLLRARKQLSEAQALVEEALKVRSDIPQFYSLMANILDEKGDVSKAESYVRTGLEKFPDSVQLNFFMGTILDKKGMKDKVVEQMKKVIEMDPKHVQGLNYLSFTYAEMGSNLDEAEVLVKRALEIEPKDGFILDTYGWVLYQKGRISDSIKMLEKAFEKQPQEGVIAEHLGDAYHKMQLFEKARAMYEKALAQTEDKKRNKEVQQKIISLDAQIKAKGEFRIPASVPGK